jgi:hypothetical protein
MINETLRSILGGKERRRLELYDNEKNSILYQALLVDDGTGNIAQLMAELHEAASREIEEFKKQKKELEDAVQPIIAKLYQQGGAPPPGEEGGEDETDKDEL